MIKIIVFDFDGVVVDSNPIKQNTYFSLVVPFKGGRNIVEEVLQSHQLQTRFFIIEKIAEGLSRTGAIGINEVTKYRDRFISEYSTTCEEEIIRCAEINGALANITKLSEEYTLYINSLTPVETLSRIVNERKLSVYFKDVFGSENTKADNMKAIISLENVTPSEVLMVGDGILDLKCALDCCTHFIGIDNHEGTLRDRGLPYFLKDCSFLYDTVKQVENGLSS